MTSPQSSPKPNAAMAQKSRQGIKALIATASLTATLGGWATLAAVQKPVSQTAPVPTIAAPQPTAPAVVIEFPPLPTLVPPPSALTAFPTEAAVDTQPAPQTTLRVVSQPPPQRGIVVSSGGGGGNGSAPQPAAQTRSSK